MKICICGSLTFTDEVMALAREIEARGEHELLLPNSMVAGLIKDPGFDPVQSKIDTNAIIDHQTEVWWFWARRRCRQDHLVNI